VVTLDGQGADEQLAGYLRYFGNYWASCSLLNGELCGEIWRAKKTPGIIGQGLGSLVKLKTSQMDCFGILDEIVKLRRKRTFQILYGENAKEKIDECLEERSSYFQYTAQTLNERLVHDTLYGLPILLRYADRNSMAYGVESRAPFLDYRILEYTSKLAEGYKIHSGWSKYIARRAFENKFPEKIFWRRDKMGFPTPEKLWLTSHLRQWGIEIIEDSAFLRTIGMRNNIINSYDCPANDSMLWRIINLALWSKIFSVQY